MLNWVVDKIIGSQNARELKELAPAVERINGLEAGLKGLTLPQLREKSAELKKRLHARIAELGGGLNPDGSVPVPAGEPEEDAGPEAAGCRDDARKKERKRRLKLEEQALWGLLPEAFALVREASVRTTGMRHFDVQLIGGMVLHRGRIAEMTTGEGKTLVATLPAYLNGLMGRGIHIVTVNDYLARRDRNWMGPIFEALGLSVGVVQHGIPPLERRKSYHSDITYGTNNEFGFDYLRDNMAVSMEECVQRNLAYAIVDEVDSILVDEARTPLIISGPAEESTDLYYRIDRIVPKLEKGKDYTVDEKAHSASLTEEGVKKAEQFLGVENLFDDTNVTLVHHIQQALRAHSLYRRDVEYMIKEGQVVIVDEFTGRLMPGRRWSDGLHQAIEAKEGVKIERENQTLATITFQNYFRMFDKLAGMTGTASTEAAEFSQIYKLEVSTIPTNRPLVREGRADVVFKSEREKFDAVVAEIAAMHEKGQPVLVGTVSIEKSERVSALLKRRQVPHHVLNARYHEQEAQIIAQAGRFGAVTIATNMAGRGTDIVLGGNPDYLAVAEIRRRQEALAKEPAAQGAPAPELPAAEAEKVRSDMQARVAKEHDQVTAVGGLHVLGTERHESRRIDNQLRGRCGRQGDPGSSRFYLSLEDDLIRLFGENKLLEWTKSSIPDGEAIEHPWLTRAVETAQKRVEMHNFDIRKRLLEYDNVMNRQREVIYRERRSVLEGRPLKPKILDMTAEVAQGLVDLHAPETQDPEEWNLQELAGAMKGNFGLVIADMEKLGRQELAEGAVEGARKAYEQREAELGAEQMRRVEHWVMLQVIDSKWKDHLYAMDHLREGIGYRVYGQQDPLVEYQHEAYQMFTRMVEAVRSEVVELIFRIQPVRTEQAARVFTPTEFSHPEAPKPASEPVSSVVNPAARFGAVTHPLSPGFQPGPRGQAHAAGAGGPAQPRKREEPKVGRNDPCHCGSGKKFKKCHGA